MHLTPRERERLLLAAAADLARRRLARGAPLGATEAVALVCDEICELAWDGVALETVIDRARTIIPAAALLPGVAGLVPVLEVEALFPWGSTLVHVDAPFAPDQGKAPDQRRTGEQGGRAEEQRQAGDQRHKADDQVQNPALERSVAPPGAASPPPPRADATPAAPGPGQIRAAVGEIALAPGAPRRTVRLRNTGPRDVWISSHFPLDQVNPAVEVTFADHAEQRTVPHPDLAIGAPRGDATGNPVTGCRLDLPAGEALLLRPGDERTATAIVVARPGD
jgi:urease gamma subunit